MRLQQNFTAGEQIRFRIPGNYFKFDSVPGGLVSARFFMNERELYEELTDVIAGWSARPAGGFDQVEITSSLTQAVSFYINRGAVDSDTFSGVVQLSGVALVEEQGYDFGVAFASLGTLAAGAVANIVAAASNVNGLVLHDAKVSSIAATGGGHSVFIAKATAPGTIVDGQVLKSSIIHTGTWLENESLKRAVHIAAGLRLDRMSNSTETSALAHALYTLK